MKRALILVGGLAIAATTAVFLAALPSPACACGVGEPGSARWHWDEMSRLEKAGYTLFGTMPGRFATAGQN